MGYIAQQFVAACWIVLMLFWLIAARTAKRTVTKGPRSASPGVRLTLVVLVVSVIVLRRRFASFKGLLTYHPAALEDLGMLLCAAGVVLAIWARIHIGRNWGMPMSLREGHELVMSGPYARVRHPIYSGVLLTMLGSALAVSAAWFVAVGVFGAYFIHSARTEERDMVAQFPEAYAAYRRRTRMLIPFVL